MYLLIDGLSSYTVIIKSLPFGVYDPLQDYHYFLDSIFVSPGFHRRLFTLSLRQYMDTLLSAVCRRQCRVAPWSDCVSCCLYLGQVIFPPASGPVSSIHKLLCWLYYRETSRLEVTLVWTLRSWSGSRKGSNIFTDRRANRRRRYNG